MCGIFGFAANSRSDITKDGLKKIIGTSIRLAERRGREASGIAIAFEGNISIYKKAIKPSAMLKSSGFNDFIESAFFELNNEGVLKAGKAVAMVGHTRLVTNGLQAMPENNQPVVVNGTVGVHNGIVTNDRQLIESHPILQKEVGGESYSDSRVLLGLIDKYFSETGDIGKALANSYQEITGSASVALMHNMVPSITVATNTGSFYYSHDKDLGFFIFGSECHIIHRMILEIGMKNTLNLKQILRLDPLMGATIDFENISPRLFSLNDKNTQALNISTTKQIYKIVDASMPAKKLRRCTKCVLPETYPFISFDEHGVCNYCNKYKKQEFLGRDALEIVLEKYRSKNGEPDCIVGFSGGRDSSYGLHVIKRELGMHPIAYTYDWALVTDQARKNQARVLGKLGIEHIIRAADIHTKRRYIRKNIYAWLKRPHLGMVPLFMAGDKMFYYYGGQLRKETGINLTIFSAGHQVEQMEFKVGFCGVDQNLINNTKLYHFDPFSKAQLAMWYARQYLMNPAYINESLLDSIFAFYTSFINKDDYLYLYRYMPWDEKLIENTIKEEYGWASDERYGTNQWRMGDGQTAFNNYIYNTIAGFSEFDNFRSNQIREGWLTRQDAVKLLENDNSPRIEMLQEFSQLIGFNLEEVLLKINSIPKLY